MKIFCFKVLLFIIQTIIIEGKEYAEAPFQKYGVILTQKKLGKYSSEIFPMVLFNEKFLCGLPSEEEILSSRNIIYPNPSVLAERINGMPCLFWRQSQWTYVVCPHIIQRIHNYNFTRNILGILYTDDYNTKNFGGFWGKGEQTFFTRHFTCSGVCGKKDFQVKVWYFCRQSKEENVFLLQRISPNKFEIRIFTPRVCSEIEFESPNGYKLYCYSEKDAMELVKACENVIESPRYTFSSDFSPSRNAFGSDIFFVANANIKLNEEFICENAPSKNANGVCRGKTDYRADELMSASSGVPFNPEVDPQNQPRDKVVYPLHQKDFQLFPLKTIRKKNEENLALFLRR